MIEFIDEIYPYERFRIEGFCDGWKKPLSVEQLINLLRKSAYRVIAVDTDNNRIVGLVTAISDEVNWAFIPDLEVVPEYRGRGIGKTLLGKMLSRLSHINCIDLTCDVSKQPFYEKFGMLKSNGMVIRKYLSE